MKNTITLLDLVNNYIANADIDNASISKDTNQISKLAQEDVEALHTSNELTFVAFQIKDSGELFDKYERICSSILMLTGKLSYHLMSMSQNTDMFSEYCACYEKHLQKRLHAAGITNIL